jgi:microcystin-dependent protein
VYGDPNNTVVNDRNLFTIKVNNDSNNNLYIKNDYAADDIMSPLWIDRATGEVHIRNLIVTKITTVKDPTRPTTPEVLPRTPNLHRNEVIIGQICMFAAQGLPDGWIECDGNTYDIKVFPELFAIIGYKYTDTSIIPNYQFSVPDLRGLFVRHIDHKRSDEATRTFVDIDTKRYPGSKQDDTFKSHMHDLHNVSNEKETTYNFYIDPPDIIAILTLNPYNILCKVPTTPPNPICTQIDVIPVIPLSPPMAITFGGVPISWTAKDAIGDAIKDVRIPDRMPQVTEYTPPV